MLLLPFCEEVFAEYTLHDEFAYSAEYNLLYTELVGLIDIWEDEHALIIKRLISEPISMRSKAVAFALEKEQRSATEIEQDILMEYSGFETQMYLILSIVCRYSIMGKI